MEQKWIKEKKEYGRHHTRVPNVTSTSTMIVTSRMLACYNKHWVQKTSPDDWWKVIVRVFDYAIDNNGGKNGSCQLSLINLFFKKIKRYELAGINFLHYLISLRDFLCVWGSPHLRSEERGFSSILSTSRKLGEKNESFHFFIAPSRQSTQNTGINETEICDPFGITVELTQSKTDTFVTKCDISTFSVIFGCGYNAKQTMLLQYVIM